MSKFIRKIIAYFRLNKKIVCEESANGPRDYHDYPDGEIPEPLHMFEHRCSRCGKRFSI